MNAEMGTFELLQTPVAVWDFLKAEAGLDVEGYDSAIIEELKKNLNLKQEDDLELFLSSLSLDLEYFITAFFKSIQPYAEMMSDLLQMFEKAGAKQTNHNIGINFDFGKGVPELSFDLRHFRDWTKVWSEVTATVNANIWNTETIWQLGHCFNNNLNHTQDEEAIKWLIEYDDDKRWPDRILAAPKSGINELDRRVERVWKVWRWVVQGSSAINKDRSVLRKLRWREDVNEQADELQLFFANVDGDCWSRYMVQIVYGNIEYLKELPDIDKTMIIRELTHRIDEFFEGIPKSTFELTTLCQQLRDFLNLPIWRRRHELYSIWIATQLLNAIGDHVVKIHHVNGKLNFSFSGTHLATVDAVEQRLHIWSELRSPLSNPVGSGRKKAIQPDYSLVSDPITSPEMSILEIECKQYRKPSTKNFASALTDYAMGRPNAHVILVNYGPADDSVLNKVEPKIRNRTSVIGMMHPGSEMALNRFKETIQQVLLSNGILASTKDSLEMFTGINMCQQSEVTLNWQANPSDLDLHVFIKANGTYRTINHQERGNLNTEPWAMLDRDARNGYGPETITIKNWTKGKYLIAVNNYSGESQLAGCGAIVTFSSGKTRWQFQCPISGSGKWWSIFELDTTTGEVIFINKLTDNPTP